MIPNPCKHKVIIGVTAASGAVYARALFDRLKCIQDQVEDCGIIFSSHARKVWDYELEKSDYLDLPWPVYQPDDFFAPMASGSAGFDTMIICPCTAGTLGRIAHGTSNDLISRAADVVLKERGRLILVIREMPYNLIHLKNMQLLTEAGAVICPASPSFYSKPADIQSLVSTVVDRILILAGFTVPHYQWRGEKGEDQ
jgi:4-hydroxy-3-polyprenylbenzoate decarboxylase